MRFFLRPVAVCFCFVLCFALHGQDPQFTQYMFNQLSFNPGVAGTENAVVTTLGIRNQWVNIPGGPVTQSLTSHFPLYRLSGGGGVTILNDIAGQQRTTSAMLDYAFHKRLGKGLISIGVTGGVVQRSLDGTKLTTPEGIYTDIIDHNDPDVPVTLENDVIPDVGAGIFFFGKHLYTGISASHLLNNRFSFGTEEGNTSMQYTTNTYVTLGYKINLGDRFTLMPNALYKTDLVISMVDLNAIATYNDNIFLGASFRTYLDKQTDAIAVMAGLNITRRISLSYSYDITASALNAVSAGSHEVVVRYKVDVAPPRAGKKINNLRYLYY